MAITSSKVAAAAKVLAAQFNALWDDLMTNHNHSSGQGGTVSHTSLSNVGTKTHTQIDTHIEGGGSWTDNPGGSKGVHGLDSDIYVVGSYGSQLIVDKGVVTLNGSGVGTVTFNGTFGASPAVIITPVQAPDAWVSLAVTARSTTGCTITGTASGWANKQVAWVAIGGQA
jgi:hypothetical protein